MLGCGREDKLTVYSFWLSNSLNISTIFHVKMGDFLLKTLVMKLHNYATTLLHWPPPTEKKKFLFHCTRFAVSIQTHFSVHLPDVWLRKPTHKPVRARLWHRQESLDSGWGKDPEKPRSALRISGGGRAGSYVTCCVRKLMKTTCSGHCLMSIRCGAFTLWGSIVKLGFVMQLLSEL